MPPLTFGWIPFDQRTPVQDAAHTVAMARMPRFAIAGRSRSKENPEKSLLYEAWKDPRVMAATNGKVYPGNHQYTGCCVGAGGGNTVFTCSAIEVARLNQSELALIPFWLLNYGRSRHYMGDDGEGEGSMGSTFAQSVREDGVIPANLDGLPSFTWDDGLSWGNRTEMHWSSNRNISDALLQQARKHLIKTTASCKSADDVREAVINGFPVSWCGDWGGLMQCPTKGTPPVLLNRHSGSWAHQQSCHAWWNHPSLGEIFFVLNNWGLDAHGHDPAGGPAGGYWVSRADCDYQARNGECFAFSQFDGFPAPDWDIPWLF